jgi:hypothetical protein
MAVQDQVAWFAALTRNAGPLGTGVPIGDALAELAAGIPQPLSVDGLRVSNDISWWRSYPCPMGVLSNGSYVVPGDAGDLKGEKRIGRALSRQRTSLQNNPFVPLSPSDLQVIANELENDFGGVASTTPNYNPNAPGTTDAPQPVPMADRSPDGTRIGTRKRIGPMKKKGIRGSAGGTVRKSHPK